MSLLFEGIHNFRDMGGLRTKDGRVVRKGLLYRCGELGFLTPKDREVLKELGIKTIIDYRDEDEVEKSPSPILEGVDNIRISAKKANSILKSASIEELMKTDFVNKFKREVFSQFYAELPIDNPAYKELMNRLKEKKVPLIHHCTAGKDRTGVGSAIIYLLLGVSEQDIIEEYLLTNATMEKNPPKWLEKVKAILGDSHELQALAFCQQIWLEAAFQKIKDVYPSYEDYFYYEFGITAQDREAMKDFYLE